MSGRVREGHRAMPRPDISTKASHHRTVAINPQPGDAPDAPAQAANQPAIPEGKFRVFIDL